MLVEPDVTWHPCLLVEISPHDGFTPPGNHVWENNNLAQKTFQSLTQMMQEILLLLECRKFKNRSRFLSFEIKWPIPRSINAYVRFLTAMLKNTLKLRLRTRNKDLKVGKVRTKQYSS